MAERSDRQIPVARTASRTSLAPTGTVVTSSRTCTSSSPSEVSTAARTLLPPTSSALPPSCVGRRAGALVGVGRRGGQRARRWPGLRGGAGRRRGGGRGGPGVDADAGEGGHDRGHRGEQEHVEEAVGAQQPAAGKQ